MNLRRRIITLLVNAVRYRFLKFTGQSGRLQAISLELTHRCICRCCMCNIWRIPNTVPDLHLSAWINLLSAPELVHLREIDITGGEPFLRDDLVELLDWIGTVQPVMFPELRTVAITTNGLLTEKILAVVGQVVAPLREQGIDLVLACGMDAVGERHDQIRNHNGAWDKLSTTLAGLKSLRKSYPNLILGIKTTIVPLNVRQLDQIARFAHEHELFTIISPCIITSNRFGNVALEEDLKFSPGDRQALMRFYEGPNFAWSGHRQAMLDYLKTGKMTKPCSAGFNTVFVRHSGDLFPCPVISTALGNVTRESLGALLSNATAVQFRRQMGKHFACQKCTEPGLERIAWSFEGLSCLRYLLRMGRRDFARLAGHMGLDKYL